MRTYFFDFRDNEDRIDDDVGSALSSLDEVRAMASKSLAEYARDIIPTIRCRQLAVEVRDEVGPVMTAKLTLEIVVLRSSSHDDCSV